MSKVVKTQQRKLSNSSMKNVSFDLNGNYGTNETYTKSQITRTTIVKEKQLEKKAEQTTQIDETAGKGAPKKAEEPKN